MKKFHFEFIKKISCELEKYKNEDDLIKIYKWRLPELPEELKDDFKHFLKEYSNGGTLSSYEITIKLREWLEKYLSKCNQEEKKSTYQWIVQNWGGIRAGRNENLNIFAAQAVEAHICNSEKYKFSRVASWSKVLAFQYPNTRAIYDVRVVYTLNWLLLKAGYSEKFFPSPSGRNSLINFFSYEKELYKKVLGLSKIKDAFDEELERKLSSGTSRKSSIINSLGKHVYIDQEYAYHTYCNLVSDIADQLFEGKDHFGVTKVEMILFSIADGDIVGEVLSGF